MSDLKEKDRIEEDRIESVPVDREELKRLHDDRRAEVNRLRRRERAQMIGRAAVLATSLGVNIALATAITVMLPLKQLVPLVVQVRDDGTWTPVISWDSAPDSIRNDINVSSLWNYIMDRESWSEGNAQQAWTVVSAMSSPEVRKQFQLWYGIDNPDSPARIYKDGTTVSLKFDHWQQVSSDTYEYYYYRIEQPKGQPPKRPVGYSSTVKFSPNVPLPEAFAWQRWAFNPTLVQVIEYPGAQRWGVAK